MNTIKKLLSVTLCILLLTSMFVACNNNPEEPTEQSTEQQSTEQQSTEGLVFELNEDGASYKVALYMGEETSVFIASTHDGKPVTLIGDYAFKNCPWIISVEIPDSVTMIGKEAFMNCSLLKMITIPDSVSSMGEGVFEQCTSLLEVTLPNSISRIESRTFYGCESLVSVTIPESVCMFYNYAFTGCHKLESIHYGGTKSQWKYMLKGAGMNTAKDCTVYCSDGEYK